MNLELFPEQHQASDIHRPRHGELREAGEQCGSQECVKPLCGAKPSRRASAQVAKAELMLVSAGRDVRRDAPRITQHSEGETYEARMREEKYLRATSEEVLNEALEAIPCDCFVWFDYKPLSDVKRKFGIGFSFTFTIQRLERRGLIEVRKVFHGASSPLTADMPAGRSRKASDLLPEYSGYRPEFMRLA